MNAISTIDVWTITLNRIVPGIDNSYKYFPFRGSIAKQVTFRLSSFNIHTTKLCFKHWNIFDTRRQETCSEMAKTTMTVHQQTTVHPSTKNDSANPPNYQHVRASVTFVN
mmetsp:Transcript_3306/g.6186  ORF Transcript_3306/g.6186 Transcript_3306/m.6186 type:complete len:110 (+) Transcript_3306:3177-3506(+)